MKDLILAAVYKEWLYKRRYLWNTILSMILFIVIFAALLSGYALIGSAPGQRTGALLVSYYAWTMMLSVYTSTGYLVAQNKQNGTLENMMCAAPRFTRLLVCESIVGSTVYFVLSWLIIVPLALLYQVRLHFLIVDVFVVLMLGLLSVLGLSLTVAGGTMLWQKADGIMGLLQFALLGGLFIPEGLPARLLVPFFCANEMLTEIFVDGRGLTQFSYQTYGALLVNLTLYLALGCLVFNVCLDRAKREGSLSYY